MIQSIQAGSSAIYNQTGNILGAGKVSTGVSASEEQTQAASAAAQNEDETTITSTQGDVLTISKAGAQQAKTFTAQSTATENTYTDAKAEAISSAAASVGITDYTAVQNENSANSAAVSSGSSSSTSSDSNLSQYTESELKEMLQNGEITQAEYNAEIKSRQETDTASDEQSEAFAVADTNEAEA